MQLFCITMRLKRGRSEPVVVKRQRQKRILNLIRAKRISTQEELRDHLERGGVPATQSSLSRDLEELGVVKHHGFYALPHANGDTARGLLSLDVAGEDAIFVAVRDAKAQRLSMKKIWELFG